MSTTTTTDLPRVTTDQFIAWTMRQPDGEHYELYDGVVVRVPNEASLHSLAKGRIAYRLTQAIEHAGLQCDVYIDAMLVEIAPGTAFEPDVVVRRGERLPDGALKVTDPLIVVEVLAPSSRIVDFGRNKDAYFRVPPLHHYLVVDPDDRRIIHFQRDADGSFRTTIIGDDPITLDPPGITIDRLFP